MRFPEILPVVRPFGQVLPRSEIGPGFTIPMLEQLDVGQIPTRQRIFRIQFQRMSQVSFRAADVQCAHFCMASISPEHGMIWLSMNSPVVKRQRFRKISSAGVNSREICQRGDMSRVILNGLAKIFNSIIKTPHTLVRACQSAVRARVFGRKFHGPQSRVQRFFRTPHLE